MTDIKQKQAEEFIKDFCVEIPYRDTVLYYWKGFIEKEMNLIPTPKTIMLWIDEVIDLAIEEERNRIVEIIKNCPDTFGIVDNKGRGGAMLVDDVINLINKNNE